MNLGFRIPDLDDDADSYGKQDSREFGIIPAEEGLLDIIRDDFSRRAGVMDDNISILMVLIWYILTYSDG